MQEYDVIVIGGSANGAQAAYSAVKKGVSVAIIEEHPNTGIPEHCSGLFSFSGLKKIDTMPPDNIIFNHNIFGSRIISPNGDVMTVRKKKPHALVCDRAAFDRHLINKATNAGATLYQPYRAVKAIKQTGKTRITIKGRDILELDAQIVISAEGIRAGIAKQLGLRGPERVDVVHAIQFYMDNLKGIDPELVEVYQAQKYAKDFFAWVIPMNATSAKVGLGTSNSGSAKYLERMISEHPILKKRCEGAIISRRTAGKIPIAGPVKRTYADGLLLTGDAAGQTKPTTGGGIILGGIAARMAGEVAADAVLRGDTSAKFLKRYQKLWKKEMQRNLNLMRLVRRYMNVLSDDEVDTLFSTIQSKGITHDIEEFGHVDDQGTLVKKFMKTWRLYPFYLRTAGRLLKSYW